MASEVRAGLFFKATVEVDEWIGAVWAFSEVAPARGRLDVDAPVGCERGVRACARREKSVPIRRREAGTLCGVSIIASKKQNSKVQGRGVVGVGHGAGVSGDQARGRREDGHGRQE